MKRHYYKTIRAHITNAWKLEIIGKRTERYYTVQELRVGGEYFLRPGKLYKVLEELPE